MQFRLGHCVSSIDTRGIGSDTIIYNNDRVSETICARANDTVNILYWNPRSYNSSDKELDSRCHLYDVIVCVETLLNSGSKPRLPGFRVHIVNRRGDRRGGGTLFFVRYKFTFDVIVDIVTSHESVKIFGLFLNNTTPYSWTIGILYFVRHTVEIIYMLVILIPITRPEIVQKWTTMVNGLKIVSNRTASSYTTLIRSHASTYTLLGGQILTLFFLRAILLLGLTLRLVMRRGARTTIPSS